MVHTYVLLRYISLSWVILCIALASLASAENDTTELDSQHDEQSPEFASSFNELRDRVRLGDTVYVTNSDGRVIEGKIGSLNDEASSVTLEKAISKTEKKWGSGERIDNQWSSIELPLTEIDRIELRYKDSLVNGALIGAGIGAGLTALSAIGEDVSGGTVAAAVILQLGLGAAVGVGIDAAIKSRKVVYLSPQDEPGLQVFVAPICSKTRKYVLVRLEF